MNVKKVWFTLFVFVFSLSLCLMSGTIEKVKELTLPGDGIKTVNIDCGAGYLNVKGEEGRKQIDVKATIEIEGLSEAEAESFIAERIQLKLVKDGSEADLTAKANSSLLKGPQSVRINLDVVVPAELALEVDDGSGSIEISGIANHVEVDDGSGSIVIKDIKGNLEIDDGSGSIDISKVEGDVEVDDGSGGINIDTVGGSVLIKDGSGSINIDGVAKDVWIKDDGSGSISIQNVKGSIKKPDHK